MSCRKCGYYGIDCDNCNEVGCPMVITPLSERPIEVDNAIRERQEEQIRDNERRREGLAFYSFFSSLFSRKK